MQDIPSIEIGTLQRVLVFTCLEESDDLPDESGASKAPIEMRHLECAEVTEHLAKRNAVPFREVGPYFKMRFRRDKMASIDLFKEACRQPKVLNVDRKKADKNKFTSALGEKKGKVFV